MLQSQGYPINFIKQATRPPRSTSTISNEPENAPPTTWRSLLYIQGISESVARQISTYNVQITHKPRCALRSSLVKDVKDGVPTLQRRNVIYQISCSGCDLHLKKNRPPSRIRARRTSMLYQAARYKACLALHCMDTGNTFNW